MAKPSKAFKKFASSGKLKETIQKRRSTQQARRKFEDRVAQRKKQRGAAVDEGADGADDDDEEDDRSDKALGVGGRAGGVGKEVDDLLKDDLRLAGPESEGDSEDEEDEEEGEEEDELDEDDELSEGEEDDLEQSEEAMKKAMKQLEKNDPEFFKYLQQNDKDLLEFGEQASGDDEDEDEDMDGAEEENGADEADEDEDGDEDEDMEGDDEEEEERAKTPVTRKMLREWQEGMLKLHSIRSLRKTLLAFRAAAHMNEEDANEGEGSSTRYTINSPLVFNKLVITALKFTPMVVAHHIPYKTLPGGKLQPKNLNPRLPKYILSHFSTILHFIRSLPATSSSTAAAGPEDGGLLVLAIQESTKLLPWIISARKTMRAYLKVLLELWSSAPNDSVRIAAFLAVRRMSEGGDDAIKDQCLKQTYRALLPPLRNTTPHTLPTINLLKNTASELFLLSPAQSYAHAFTAIRMLAVHLRDVIRSTTLQSGSSAAAGAGGEGKEKEKGGGTDKAEAFRRVYNWQYVHCIDFWGRVLGGAAVRERDALGQGQGQKKEGKDEGLGMLVYPFVQVALGVVRLLPSPRYFPLHFHILSTLQTLCSQSQIYIPLSPYLLDILSSSEFRPSSTPRKSTLKPLDLEYVIRAPATYPRTRIYQETLSDELVYLLASYHADLVYSIAFPEIVLPVILQIKKHLKRSATGGKGKGMSPKVAQSLKGLVDKLEAQKKWSEEKRRSVGFAPRDRAEVGRWEGKVGEERDKTPLGMWVRTMRKVRDRRREEVEKALRGEE